MLNEEQLQHLMGHAEENDYGMISYAPFVDLAAEVIMEIYDRPPLPDTLATAPVNVILGRHLLQDDFERLLDESFRATDEHGTGMLNRAELRRALTFSAVGLTPIEVNMLMFLAEEDKDGVVFYADYLPRCFDVVRHYTTRELARGEAGGADRWRELLHNVFAEHDTEGAGFLHTIEVRNLLMNAAFALTNLQIYDLMSCVWENDDGLVHYPDIVDAYVFFFFFCVFVFVCVCVCDWIWRKGLGNGRKVRSRATLSVFHHPRNPPFPTRTATRTQATNRPGPACSDIFDGPSVTSFGAGAICLWETASTLLIQLKAGVTIEPSDTVTITGDLETAAENSGELAGAFTVLSSVAPVAPIAHIQAPPSVANCDSLLLDSAASSGAFGRPWDSRTWTLVSGPNTAVTNATKLVVDAATGVRVSVGATDLSVGTYVFSLTVTNFLGLTSAPAMVTVQKSAQAPPVLAITGPTEYVITSCESLTVVATASPASSACWTDSTVINFAWSVVGGGATLDTASASTGALYIGAGTLTAGASYQLSLTASMASNPAVSSTVTANVTVGQLPLRVEINGGDNYISRRNQNEIRLTAAVLDPDQVTPVAYTWSCVDVTVYDAPKPCATRDGTVLTPPTTNEWTIDNLNRFGLLAEFQFSVSVDVGMGANLRTAEDTATVIIEQVCPWRGVAGSCRGCDALVD